MAATPLLGDVRRCRPAASRTASADSTVPASTVDYKVRAPFPGPKLPDGVEWDPTGTRLYAWYGTAVVEIVDGKEQSVGTVDGRIEALWPVGDDVWAVGTYVTRVGSPGRKGHDGQVLAVSGGGGRMLTVDSVHAWVWDLATGERGPNLVQPNDGGAISPDGRSAVTWTGTTLRVFCVAGTTLAPVAEIPVRPDSSASRSAPIDWSRRSPRRPRVRTARFHVECR